MTTDRKHHGYLLEMARQLDQLDAAMVVPSRLLIQAHVPCRYVFENGARELRVDLGDARLARQLDALSRFRPIVQRKAEGRLALYGVLQREGGGRATAKKLGRPGNGRRSSPRTDCETWGGVREEGTWRSLRRPFASRAGSKEERLGTSPAPVP